MNKHKHYEMIMAWAAGETLEFWSSTLERWVSFTNKNSIDWNFEPTQFRIKPDEELSEKNAAYEQGFIDGMAKQCESSPWVDLTTEEINAVYIADRGNYRDDIDYADFFMIACAIEAKLKEKNEQV